MHFLLNPFVIKSTVNQKFHAVHSKLHFLMCKWKHLSCLKLSPTTPEEPEVLFRVLQPSSKSCLEKGPLGFEGHRHSPCHLTVFWWLPWQPGSGALSDFCGRAVKAALLAACTLLSLGGTGKESGVGRSSTTFFTLQELRLENPKCLRHLAYIGN